MIYSHYLQRFSRFSRYSCYYFAPKTKVHISKCSSELLSNKLIYLLNLRNSIQCFKKNNAIARLTTIPMAFCSPVLQCSIASSITKFINGSNPRSTPTTFLAPFSFSCPCIFSILVDVLYSL